jgi:hypothetical protein
LASINFRMAAGLIRRQTQSDRWFEDIVDTDIFGNRTCPRSRSVTENPPASIVIGVILGQFVDRRNWVVASGSFASRSSRGLFNCVTVVKMLWTVPG